jgi:hypothetical protein
MRRILLLSAVAAMVVVGFAVPALAAQGGIPTGNAPVAGCPSGSGSNFVSQPTEITTPIAGAASIEVNSEQPDSACFKSLPNAPLPLQKKFDTSNVQVVTDNTVSGPK